MPSNLTDSFYPNLVREILPACGHEFSTHHFSLATEVLNEELRLNLPRHDEQALGLMLTALSQAHRFGEDPYIERRRGENSAVHSVHTAILMNEVFRRAGLFDEKHQSQEVDAMRVDCTLACLIHDMGEALGEFNSLSQRVQEDHREEDSDIERKVFETVLRLAFDAVSKGPRAQVKFLERMDSLRRDAGILATSDQVDPEQIAASLEKFKVGKLEDKYEQSIELFMNLFDMVELRGDSGLDDRMLYRGYVVKAIEHTQGTRHLIRFCEKSDDYN